MNYHAARKAFQKENSGVGGIKRPRKNAKVLKTCADKLEGSS